MYDLSPELKNSRIWQNTLSADIIDGHEICREKLRVSFTNFRERAAQLAVQVHADLPSLTIHDITHLDALWEVASKITGSEVSINPAEAYVLGGAILLHDIAMSVAATPGGLQAIKDDLKFKDYVTNAYKIKHSRLPNPSECLNPEPAIFDEALFFVLRQVHANNAEQLAHHSFKKEERNFFLIEENELRQFFGDIIGKVAHSHHWNIDQLEKNFSIMLGAPYWAPSEWTIDGLKLACILRLADAAHIDGRRAPMFTNAFSKITGSSSLHWTFQEKLGQVYVEGDALVFTSSTPFELKDANSWWLCLETLKMIDSELRTVDALLADKKARRFAVRRVAGIDNPERLATYIKTEKWLPINASVHISDLPHIVKTIGGIELYGDKPLVALRELIQNASDAIRARRLYEPRGDDFGKIKVSIEAIDGFNYLIVEDDGVGMSKEVLTKYLLDFGSSFWSSDKLSEYFPGLISAGFAPTGKYGIGFFSVFMIAENVTVVSRPCDLGKNETLVLEFGLGLGGRPLLRPANKSEILQDPGTRVKLRLLNPLNSAGGLIERTPDASNGSLAEQCTQLAISIDVDLDVCIDGKFVNILKANDWKTISGTELLNRVTSNFSSLSKIDQNNRQKYFKRIERSLLPVLSDDGSIIGRLSVCLSHKPQIINGILFGAISVGGFKASQLKGVCGLIFGKSKRAARDEAELIVSYHSFKVWADEQAKLVPAMYSDFASQAFCAGVIRQFGGNVNHLPIGLCGDTWITANDISGSNVADEIVILDLIEYQIEVDRIKRKEIPSNVFRIHCEERYNNSAKLNVNLFLNENYLDSWVTSSSLVVFLDSLAKAWQIDVALLYAIESDDLDCTYEIGKFNDEPIEIGAIVINKFEVLRKASTIQK